MAQTNMWPLIFYTALIVAITSFVCCGCWILKRITSIRKKREQQTIVEMFRAVLRRQPMPVQGPIPYRGPPRVIKGVAPMSPIPQRAPGVGMPVSPGGPVGPVGPAGPVGPVGPPVYGTQNERQRLIPVNQPVPLNQIPASQVQHAIGGMRGSQSLYDLDAPGPIYKNSHSAPGGNGNVYSPVVSAMLPPTINGDIAPSYATVTPRNNPVRVLASNATTTTTTTPSSTTISSGTNQRRVLRVNTYDDLENCDVDQTFFAGQHRIHMDSMEYERTRTNAPPPQRAAPVQQETQRSRSHEDQSVTSSKSRDKPNPPIRKTPVQVVVNQNSTYVEPIADYPPPPPYTETDPIHDPSLAANFRNAMKVQCYA